MLRTGRLSIIIFLLGPSAIAPQEDAIPLADVDNHARLKVMIVFGTRPEAIKMWPLIRRIRGCPDMSPIVVESGQHGGLVDDVVDCLALSPDIRLPGCTDLASLAEKSAALLAGLALTVGKCRPDLVLVQGDTITTHMAALAAHYARVAIGHVEAGLRSHDLSAPWPEESSRRQVSALAQLHFAPTALARDNLLSERIPTDSIAVTGNTGIDALRMMKDRHPTPPIDGSGTKLILATIHRRESAGEPVQRIAEALRTLSRRPDVRIICPVHPNPELGGMLRSSLHGGNVELVDPLSYPRLVETLSRAWMVITDSGGLQEEAPSLGVPVLVVRDKTERPEGIDAGIAKLVGTQTADIVDAAGRLLNDPQARAAMALAVNPYGDGYAADRIVKFVREWARSRGRSLFAQVG